MRSKSDVKRSHCGESRDIMVSQSVDMFKRGAKYIRSFGLKSFTKKLAQKIRDRTLRPLSKSLSTPPTVISFSAVEERIRYQEVPRLRPLGSLQVFSTPSSGRRLNLVTDSINAESLFGGVSTAIIFCSLLSKRLNCQLRVITRTERAASHNFFDILKNNKIPCESNVEFMYVDLFSKSIDIDVSSDDLFVATSWWTAYSCLESVGADKIIYLLQEDERMFYPYGDDHLRCSSVLKNYDIRFVVNTKLLFDHFVSQGFDNISQNGQWFEPSFSSYEARIAPSQPLASKKKFFFYARPNNYRNLFYLGLATLNAAVSRGILNPEVWEICFVGQSLSTVSFPVTFEPTIVEGLSWSEYMKFIGLVDIGLSLMYTPHPSYPPLDLAASGSIAVTNQHGVKQDLSRYSDNIICKQPDVESLLKGIEEAIKLSENESLRIENYENNKLLKDWEKSFESVLEDLQSI